MVTLILPPHIPCVPSGHLTSTLVPQKSFPHMIPNQCSLCSPSAFVCVSDCCWSQHIYLLNFALALAMYVDCWDHSEFSLCPLWQVFSLPGWCHLNNWLADIFETTGPRTQSYIQTGEIFILIDTEPWRSTLWLQLLHRPQGYGRTQNTETETEYCKDIQYFHVNS